MSEDASYVLQIIQENAINKPEKLKYVYEFKELLLLSSFSDIRLKSILKELKSFGYIKSTTPTDGNAYTLISFYSYN